METNCDVICLQETKREAFDQTYLKLFCPPLLTLLTTFHQLGPLEGLSSFGKVPSFMDNVFSKMHMHPLSCSPL